MRVSPRLLPYTWVRHVVPALCVGAATLVAWWGVLTGLAWLRDVGTVWSPDAEGVLLLGVVAATSAGAQLAVEGRVERTRPGVRAAEVAGAAALAWVLATAGVWMWLGVAEALGMPAGTLALRWRLGGWVAAGMACGIAPGVVRSVRQLLERIQIAWDLRFLPTPPPAGLGRLGAFVVHVVGGMAAGLVAGTAAYAVGHEVVFDAPFLAGAVGCWLLGAVPASLGWAVPDRRFQGWISVLSGSRPGWRVPLDAGAVALSERFVGHFPTGMDLHLPATDGVAELHASFVAHGDGRWGVRGLSRRPIRVRRFLERVDLAYEAGLPAPLETPLRSEDRVRLGEDAELEFVVVPREAAP